MNLNEIMNDMEKTSNQENDFFKFPVGETKIRLLTQFHQTFSLYKGTYPNSKYVKMLPHFKEVEEGYNLKTSAWAWAIIRGKVDKLKIVQFPYALIKALQGMQNDPEWKFDTLPMEYDITIGNTGEGGARYSLRGSPSRSKVLEDTLTSLKGKKSCEEIASKIIASQNKETTAPAHTADNYPTNENDPNDEGITAF